LTKIFTYSTILQVLSSIKKVGRNSTV